MRWTTLCNENDDDDDDTMAAVLSCDTFGWLRCFLVTHLDISRYSITAAYDVYIRAFVVSSCLPYPIPILRSCFGFDAILVTSRLSPTSLYRFTLAFSIRTVSLHPFNNHCTICGHLSPRFAIAVTACAEAASPSICSIQFVVSACLPYPISCLRRCFGFDAILAHVAPASATLIASRTCRIIANFDKMSSDAAEASASEPDAESEAVNWSDICIFRMLAVSHSHSQEMFWT